MSLHFYGILNNDFIGFTSSEKVNLTLSYLSNIINVYMNILIKDN